jgi:hypothetical protein
LRLLETQVVVLLALALPAAASANDFQNVYRQYKRTGTITPCRFTDKQLSNAEKQTPPDVEQYAPSFLDALQAAREHSADCNTKAATPAPASAPATPVSNGGPPTPSTPTPAPAPSPTPTATALVATPTATTPAPTVPAQPTVPGVPSPPIALAAQHDSAPAVVWLLAVLGGLVVLCAVFAGLAWWFGWSADRSMRPWRASWDDFRGRLSDAGVEFRDWLRTGH